MRWPLAAVILGAVTLCNCGALLPDSGEGRPPEIAAQEIAAAQSFCLITSVHSTVSGQVKVDDHGVTTVNYSVQYDAKGAAATWSGGSFQKPVLPGPAGVRAAAAPATVYASDVTYSAVRVINPSTATIVATIPLHNNDAPQGIVVTPDARFVWVVDQGSLPPDVTPPSIQIIDTSTNQVTGSLKFANNVYASWIAMTPDGKTAYVTNEGEYFLGINNAAAAVNSVLIIDVASRTITGQIQPPLRNPQLPNAGHAHFEHLAVSPDGTLLYVASPGLGYFVYDVLTNTQIYPPTSYPYGVVNFFDPNVYPANYSPVVFHPNGARVYYYSVVCPQSNPGRTCLVAIDTKTHTAVQWAALQPGSSSDSIYGLGITPTGRTAWVKELVSGDFIPIDIPTFTAGKHLPGPPNTYGVFVNLPPQ